MLRFVMRRVLLYTVNEALVLALDAIYLSLE